MKTWETARLILRPYTEDDLTSVHSYASNYENIRYMVWGPNTEDNTKTFIQLAIAKSQENPCKDYQYAVVLKSTNQLIGGCGITITDSDEGEIGWLLHRDYWKQGYGTEIGRFLLEFGFKDLDLRRIIAHCDSENYGSYRIMERNGMRREGVFIEGRPANKLSGRKFSDEYSYAILKREWKSKR